MNKILLKLIVFVTLSFSSLMATAVIILTLSSASKKHKISEQKSVLIIGNSQSEYGLNDTIIPNSLNMSQSGDCSFYNYFKTKKLIDDNNQLKTVLYLYTNNMFLKGMDEWIYDEKHLGFKYPKYAHVIDFKNQWFLFTMNPKSFLIAIRDAVRSDVQFLIKGNEKMYIALDWGSFKTTNQIGNMSKVVEEFDLFYRDSSTSEIDLLYIKKLQEYCATKNVNFILVRTPYHNSFRKVKERELQEYKTKFLTNCTFLDYSDTLFFDNEFKDVQHLNYFGSKRLSNMVNNALKPID